MSLCKFINECSEIRSVAESAETPIFQEMVALHRGLCLGPTVYINCPLYTQHQQEYFRNILQTLPGKTGRIGAA